MLCKQWSGEGDVVQFRVRVHSLVKHSLRTHKTGNIIHQILRKHWRYAGRLARQDDTHLAAECCFGDNFFETANKTLHHRNPAQIIHRVSGAQKPTWDSWLHRFWLHVEWLHWKIVAQNCDQRKSFEEDLVKWTYEQHTW